MNIFYKSVIITVLSIFTGTLAAQAGGSSAEVKVAVAGDLKKALDKAKPGDTLILADAQLKDFYAEITVSGLKDRPITIKAKNPGNFVLSGQSGLALKGDWLVLEGIVFKDGNPPIPTNPTDFSAGVINVYGSNNRVTQCSIINFSEGYVSPPGTDPSKKDYHKWVGLWGSYNRVDHSWFQGKKKGGTLLTVWRDGPEPNYHRIDHNVFKDVEYGKEKNGWETIRLGDSKESQSSSFSVVEDNYFENCNGEIEFISNKSGGNVYRNNLIINSQGCLTLRHGNNCVVENNIFLQNGVSFSGGIRVMDKGHIIRNNYIEGAKGKSNVWGGIVFMNHNDNPPLNDYWPISDVKVENNSIINSINSIVIGGGRGKKAPISAEFKNNVVRTGLDGNTRFPMIVEYREFQKASWDGDYIYGSVMSMDDFPEGAVNDDPQLEKSGDFWVSKKAGLGARPSALRSIADFGPETYRP